MFLKYHEKSYGFINPIIKLGNIFGVIPYYDFKIRSLSHEILSKIYGLLLVVYIITALIAPYSILVSEHTVMTPHLTTLQFFIFVNTILFILTTVLGSSFWNMRSWERLLNIFSLSEYCVEWSREFYLNTSFLFLVGGAPGIVLSGYMLYSMGGLYAIPILVYYLTKYITTCTICYIVSLIRNRYKTINNTFGDISRCTVIRTSTVKQLQDITRVYIETDKAVELFNILFGWPLLLIFSECMQGMLLSLAIMTEHGFRLPVEIVISEELYILNILCAFVSMVSNLQRKKSGV